MTQSAATSVQHFTLEERVGVGGMGTVWAARDNRSGDLKALKILRPPDPATTELWRARLLREVHASRHISHPAIVPVEEVLEHDGCPVLVMELLRGETLRQRLQRDSRLDVQQTAILLAPVADALSVAHRAGIVHRDLKPENIFIQTGRAARVRLLDFGIARLHQPPAELGNAPITALGTLLGTLAYMAPEQALQPSDCNHQVDAWALGVILYEMLSGCRPIEGTTGPETMRQLLVGGITPLAAVTFGLPESLCRLVDAMLSRTPERRPQDLSNVARDLTALVAER